MHLFGRGPPLGSTRRRQPQFSYSHPRAAAQPPSTLTPLHKAQRLQTVVVNTPFTLLDCPRLDDAVPEACAVRSQFLWPGTGAGELVACAALMP